MSLYASGKRSGIGSGKIEVVDVSERIAAVVRENGGRLGNLDAYTATEMKFIIETIREMALEETIRISFMGWMSGIDISKVVDTCETVGEGGSCEVDN